MNRPRALFSSFRRLMDRESWAMVARALAIVRSSDGVAFAKARAEAQLWRAKEALPAYIPAAVRETFIQAADYIGRRDF